MKTHDKQLDHLTLQLSPTQSTCSYSNSFYGAKYDANYTVASLEYSGDYHILRPVQGEGNTFTSRPLLLHDKELSRLDMLIKAFAKSRIVESMPRLFCDNEDPNIASFQYLVDDDVHSGELKFHYCLSPIIALDVTLYYDTCLRLSRDIASLFPALCSKKGVWCKLYKEEEKLLPAGLEFARHHLKCSDIVSELYFNSDAKHFRFRFRSISTDNLISFTFSPGLVAKGDNSHA